MTFREIASRMGIEDYPEALDTIYLQNPALPVTRQVLTAWQESYDLFGEFFDDVLRGFADLQEKPAEFAWTATTCRYLQSATCAQAKVLALPVVDGSPARDMLPLFVLLSRVDWAMEEYIRRGFDREQVLQLMQVFQGDFRANVRQCGRPGVNKTYYNWTVLVMYCLLLPCRGFKFDIRKPLKTTLLLRNKQDGKTAVLVYDVPIHKSGHRVGTAGCTDEQGAFTPTLEETEAAWIGYAADKNGLVWPEKKVFPKESWELLVKPGDDILGIHIPKGADIRPEAVGNAIEGALAHIRRYYPEYHIKAIHCTSWLLSPELGELVGKQSKLALFSDMFTRYPTVSNGKAVFGFVFNKGSNTDIQALPEDTSLQRAVKQRYLQGGYVHAFGGYIPI